MGNIPTTLFTRRQNDSLENIDNDDMVIPPVLNLSGDNNGSKESTKRKRMPKKTGIALLKPDNKKLWILKSQIQILRACSMIVRMVNFIVCLKA